MRINPHYPEWYLGDLARANHMAGRYKEALTTFEKMGEPIRSFREGKAATNICLGRIEDALAEFAEFYDDRAELDRFIEHLREAGPPE